MELLRLVGLSLPVPRRRRALLPIFARFLDSPFELDVLLLLLLFIRYAAVCKAVAAADRLAALARAVASFCAQSGRILSVVITPGASADKEVARRRVVVVPGLAFAEFNELDDDIGEATAPR